MGRTPDAHKHRERQRYADLTPEQKAARIKQVNQAQARRRAAEAARQDAEIAHAEALEEEKTRERDKVALEARNLAISRYSRDYWAFYTELLASRARIKQTGRTHAESLGALHKVLIDFLCAEHHRDCTMHSVESYSSLVRYLPAYDPETGYQERWLYWPRLSLEPIMQDGPVGKLSEMFYTQRWQGVLIRLCGKRYKCIQLARGHLKSELCTKGFTTWKTLHDPALRFMAYTVNEPQGKKILAGISEAMELKRVRDIYGHLIPARGDDAKWGALAIQLLREEKLGTDYTVEVAAINGSKVGSHCDYMWFDDVVADKTTGGEDAKITEKTNLAVMRLQGILDPGAPLWNVGTPWADNDAHSLFMSKDGPYHDDCSFMVATCIDDDPDGAVRTLHPFKPGNPMWRERFSALDIVAKRKGMPIDREFFGQYFCQFAGTQTKLFKQDWIQTYEASDAKEVREAAKLYKMRVFGAVDTASGKIVQKGKFDPTGCLILGQSTLPGHETEFFLLDGFKERIDANDMAGAIVDKFVKWKRFCDEIGTEFLAGFEATAYTTFVQPMIRRELKERGLEGYFSVKELLHQNRAKESRIRLLAKPHADGWIAVPLKLIVPCVGKGEPYDLVAEWRAEFIGYPHVSHEELLDCEAYCWEMAEVERQDRPGAERPAKSPERYTRRKYVVDEETGDAIPEDPHDGYEDGAPPGYEGHGWEPPM